MSGQTIKKGAVYRLDSKLKPSLIRLDHDSLKCGHHDRGLYYSQLNICHSCLSEQNIKLECFSFGLIFYYLKNKTIHLFACNSENRINITNQRHINSVIKTIDSIVADDVSALNKPYDYQFSYQGSSVPWRQSLSEINFDEFHEHFEDFASNLNEAEKSALILKLKSMINTLEPQ